MDEGAEEDSPTWFYEQAFSCHKQYCDFLNVTNTGQHLVGVLQIWDDKENAQVDADNFILVPDLSIQKAPSTMQALSILQEDLESSENGSSSSSKDEALFSLASSLAPLLTTVVLDYAPIVFSPSMSSAPQTELQLLLCSLRIAKILYRRITQMVAAPSYQISQELWPILFHLAPYFPATYPALLRRDIKVRSSRCQRRRLTLSLA